MQKIMQHGQGIDNCFEIKGCSPLLCLHHTPQ